MAVPPTSPLRVFPQAVDINVQGFMPQGDLFQKTMGAFEAGSKLPLMQEQIKHEKKRIKMENAQLDYAMSDVFRQEQKAAREAAAKKSELENDSLTLANAKLKQEIERGRPLTDEETAALISSFTGGSLGGEPAQEQSVDTPQTATAQEQSVDTPQTAAPLAGESVFDGSFGNRMIPSAPPPTAKDTAAKPLITLEQSGKVGKAPTVVFRASPVGRMTRIPDFGGINGEFVTTLPQIDETNGNSTRMLPEEGAIVRSSVQREISMSPQTTRTSLNALLKEKSTPKVVSQTVYDSQRVPYTVKVRTIAGESIARVGEPRLDMELLYKENPAQKEEDVAFKKRIGEMSPAAKANASNNLQRLMNSVQYIQDAEASGSPIDSTRLSGLLPTGIAQTLLANKTSLAQDEVRSVVQQSLRETLGGQFAEREGTQMMNRAFNPLFGPDANLAKIGTLMGSVVEALTAQQQMEDYFRDNGTLKGFERPLNVASNNPLTDYVESKMTVMGGGNTTPAAPPTKARKKAEANIFDLLGRRTPLGTKS